MTKTYIKEEIVVSALTASSPARSVESTHRTGLAIQRALTADAERRAKNAEAALAKVRAVIEMLEFGTYHIIGGREGKMCGSCYRFKREGHADDCAVGKAIRALATSEEKAT